MIMCVCGGKEGESERRRWTTTTQSPFDRLTGGGKDGGRGPNEERIDSFGEKTKKQKMWKCRPAAGARVRREERMQAVAAAAGRMHSGFVGMGWVVCVGTRARERDRRGGRRQTERRESSFWTHTQHTAEREREATPAALGTRRRTRLFFWFWLKKRTHMTSSSSGDRFYDHDDKRAKQKPTFVAQSKT